MRLLWGVVGSLVVGRLGAGVVARFALLGVGVLLERNAAERPEIQIEARAVEFAEPPLHALQPGLRAAQAGWDAREGRDARVEIERLLIGLRRPREVIALLRHATQPAGALPQRIAALHVAARQLRRVAL